MPAETARVPSPHHEPRRMVLQRQTSITQTIRRYRHILSAHRLGLGQGPGGRHTESPLGTGDGNGAKVPSLAASSSVLIPATLHPPPVLGIYGWHSTCHSVPRARTLLSSHPNTLAPHRQVRFGRVHTLPLLGPRAACKALPQRQSLSWSLLRYLMQVLSVLVFSGTCMLCSLLELLECLT